MSSLRYLTAGESHGPGLVAILEGLPAGVPVSTDALAAELARRRHGHGRGPRMKIERDGLEILAGVRGGKTLGSPVAIVVRNTEWERWSHIMPLEGEPRGRKLTRPRPGHADAVGMLKYGFEDARDVLERASARETAARSAIGAVARSFLSELGIEIVAHVVSIGTVRVPSEAPRPGPGDLAIVDASPVRCFDEGSSALMIGAIDEAAEQRDSLGGIIEVLAFGVPTGLGSHVHWDRRIDGRIAGALMAVPAIKAVEFGDGFTVASKMGSEAHDEIELGLERTTDRAGGTEGGMTIGGTLRIRAAMKPLSTVGKRLRTIDMETGDAAESFQERTDVCAVPAAGVVCESVLALVLAEAVLEMFGGDTLGDVKRRVEDHHKSLQRRLRR